MYVYIYVYLVTAPTAAIEEDLRIHFLQNNHFKCPLSIYFGCVLLLGKDGKWQ